MVLRRAERGTISGATPEQMLEMADEARATGKSLARVAEDKGFKVQWDVEYIDDGT